MLKIYGVGGQLLKGIKAFYSEANACVRVGGKYFFVYILETASGKLIIKRKTRYTLFLKT